MTTNFNPAFKIVRDDISNDDAINDAIKRIATQLSTPNILAEDPVFLAYLELPRIGPKNDYDGVRSSAIALKREWEQKVLWPAQIIRSRGF